MNQEFQTFEDCVQPFMIHHSAIRGRVVRLGTSLDTILRRHEYPEPVSRLLAEMIVIGSMLSANLKGRGLLTIQLKGEGPVRFMVVDATAEGEMRGYAEIAEDVSFGDALSLPLKELVGKGYLAITLDQGKEPYQGIVELAGDSLSESVQSYFTNSEQSEVFIKIGVGKNKQPGETSCWYAGGVMLQHVPHEGGIRQDGSNVMHYEGEDPHEQWNRAIALSNTVQDAELLDTYLPPQELLYRLFNEDGVWAYDLESVSVGCRCSRDKISNTLSQFPQAEIEQMLEDNQLVVNCQFCNQAEIFSAAELAGLYPPEAPQ